MNASDVRKAHKLLDYVSQGRAVLDDELKLLRSFLPDLPKQMTLEEITEHVRDAWIGTSDNGWAGNSYNRESTLESWMGELYVQLKGLKDMSAAVPVRLTPPEFLETEADYENAPEGTVVASSGRFPWVKGAAGEWACSSSNNSNFAMSKIGRRNVLRWGWGK